MCEEKKCLGVVKAYLPSYDLIKKIFSCASSTDIISINVISHLYLDMQIFILFFFCGV